MERKLLSDRLSESFRTIKLTLGCLIVFLFSSNSFADSGISYHGRIVRPNGSPVTSPTTQFRIQVRSPGAENCLLWEEQQQKDLSNTNGLFSVTINDTDEPSLIVNTLPFSLERVFSNRLPYTGLTGCSSGTSYTPSSALDGRKLQVFFREDPADPWEQMPAVQINFVPLALNSVQLEGYSASEFLKIDPASSYTALTATQVNTLMDIIAGTNTQYLRPTSSFSGDVTGTAGAMVVERIRGTNVVATAPTSGQVLKFDGTNWVPSADATGAAPGDASYAAKGIVQIDTDLATSGLNIASGVLSLPNLVTAGSVGSASAVPVITFDAKGRITATSTATVNDTSKLPLAGGTMTGPIDMGTQNITNATSVAATNISTRNVVLNDNDTHTITLRAPTDVTPGSYSLTFPATAGTSGYVLSTDGLGNLSWISPSAGSVTSVTSANSDISVANTTTTPVLTLNSGTGANQIVKLDASSRLPAVDGSQLTNLNPANLSTVVPTTKGGTGLSSIGTANQILGVNSGATGLEYKTITAGTGVTISHGANSVTINATGSGGTVTSVTSANSYLSVANTTTTPVITANVGTAANTLAAGDDARITGALQSSAYSADLADVDTCTSTEKPSWNTVTDKWDCVAIGTVANATTAVNFSGSLAGDVSGTQGATSVDKIKGKNVSAATAANQIMIYDGTNWVNNILSGDATLASTGALTLANTIGSSGTVGSASAVPAITYDAKGRITAVSSSAYQDATAAQKGIVQIGSNITVSSGTISVSGSNVTAALGYTPLNKAGDTMGGTLGLHARASDPDTTGWNATQKGYMWFNSSTNQVKYWDGAAIQALGVSGSGLTSLGGQTGSTQTFAAGTAGNSPAITSSADVHTLNVPLASAGASVTSGTISNADYVSFSGKLTSPLTTKGDLLTRDATTHVRLPVGTNGQVLSANSATASGLEWITPATGDITDVVAGSGLTGGATSNSATLNVGAGTGIIVNADDIAVDVGTADGKIVQVQTGGKLPALDGSDLTNLDAGDIATGTLPIARGGTGATTANAALNNLLPAQATHAGKVLSTDGTNTSWVAAATGTVTSVTSANSYLSVATTTTTPVITANVGTTANTLAAGDDSRITGALQSSAYSADLADVDTCTATEKPSWNTVTDKWECVAISGFVTTSTGFVQNGNSFGAPAVLGTNDNFDLNFETNGTTKMTVLANGNVGIGTTSPQRSLQIDGGDGVEQIIRNTGATTGNQSWGIQAFGGNLNFRTLDDGVTAETGVGKVLSLTRAGNVGIGTSNPTYKLQVHNPTAQVSATISTDANVNSILNFASDLDGTPRYGAVGYDYDDNVVKLVNDSNFNTSAKGIAIDTTGNVGIGTVAPGAKLEVAGQIKITGGTPGAGKVLTSDATGLATWTTMGGSESTSVSNVGVGGVSPYKQMNGSAIELRSINAATSAVSVALDAANNEVDIGVNAELGGLAGLATTGFVKRTGAGAYSTSSTVALGSEVTGTLPIANGGTGATTATAALNNLLPAQGTNAGKVLTTDGTNASWTTAASGTVTSVTSANSYLSVATTTTTPVITANVGTTANTLAAGDDSRITGALQSSAYSADLADVDTCTATEKPSWNTVTDKWECVAISGFVTTSTGFVQNGNSFGAPAVLGTNESQPLHFETNSTTQMTILPSGNIGFGTTNPGAKLHVLNGVAAYENNAVSTAGPYFSFWKSRNYSAVSSGDELGFISFYGHDGSGIERAAYIAGHADGAPVDASNSVPGRLSFFTTPSGSSDATERMRITSDGNVGIGTTTPDATAKLTVAGQIKITGGTPGAGKVLTSDASGLATWTTMGGSESTSVSNVGAGGVSPYKQMNGTAIELRSINAASSAVSVALDAANNEIDIGVNAELAGLAGLSANGFVKRTGAGAYSTSSTVALGSEVTGTLPIANGGTGATTATAALNNLLPAQGTNAGKVLSTDGTNASWVTPNAGTVTSVTSANTDISVATTTTTPVLTLNSGTGANQIVKLDASSRLPAVNGSLLTSLNAGNISSGTLATARGGTGLSSIGTANQILGVNSGATGLEYKTITAGSGVSITHGANSVTISATGSGGTVTSITAGTGLTGGTITGSGTIGLGTELTGLNGLSTTGFVKRTGAGTYSAAAIASSDLPVGLANGNILQNTQGTSLTTNNLLVTNATGIQQVTTPASGVMTASGTYPTWATSLSAPLGGTGQTSYTIGDLLYASSTSALSKLAAGTSGYVLKSNGPGTAPSWQADSTGANPAGSTSEVQFRSTASTFGANANIVIDNTNTRLGVGTSSPGERLDVSGNLKIASGQAWVAIQTPGTAASVTINANSGNSTVWDAGATANPVVNLHNLKAGGSYLVVVKGTGTGSVSINCYSDAGTTALPAGWMPANGSRVDGPLDKTMYNVVSDGTNCLITWVTGF